MEVLHIYRKKGLMFSHKVSEHPADIAPAAHERWELIFVKNANTNYMVNGKHYAVGRNSLIITRPMDHHSIYFLDRTEAYDRYVIAFDPSLMQSGICEIFPKGVDVIGCNGNTMICDLFRKLDHYAEVFEDPVLQVLISHTVEEILCNSMRVAQETAEEAAQLGNPLIEKAVAYIRENITEPIDVEELAQQLCISKSHVNHIFTKHLKVAPKKYIVFQKLILARRELCAGAKATEVCAKLGFGEYSGFYRQYMHRFGHKPSEAMNHQDETEEVY